MSEFGLTPWVTIDHAALRFNINRVRQTAPNSAIWAVIKAGAYGHDMERVATTLSDADGFAHFVNARDVHADEQRVLAAVHLEQRALHGGVDPVVVRTGELHHRH